MPISPIKKRLRVWSTIQQTSAQREDKGCKAIAELLTLTDEIRAMLIEKWPIRRIKDAVSHRID